MKKVRPQFIEELYNRIRGDVYDDPVTLGIYATYTSIYQILPIPVVCPRD